MRPFILRMPRFLVKAGVLLLVGCAPGGQATPDQADQVEDHAEVMPRFPGCETLDLPSEDARYRCSIERLLDYIAKGLVYPEEARAKGTSGEAVVQFIVRSDGTVEFVKILQDPGDGLGAAAEARIRRMIDDGIIWKPGLKNGQPVGVRFNLPIRFNPPPPSTPDQ